MDVLIFCTSGVTNSLISCCWVAVELKKAGADVGVIFGQEALAALMEDSYYWPPSLAPHAGEMPERARARGLSTNPKEMLRKAKKHGVPLYTCPAWVGLLGLKGQIPEELEEMDIPTIVKATLEAKKIIGRL